MAASPLNPKSNYHARSNSLPSKLHPLIVQCNEHLARLEASDATSSSSSLFSHKLSCIQDLHDSVEKLIQLPHTQQVLVQESQVDELLDGSLRLLDVCTAGKDALLHTKECTRELQSIMRRRRGGEFEIAAEVRKYLTTRKIVRKAVIKALGNLKGVANKSKFSPSNKDHQTMALFGLLKDVEVATLAIFESLLKFISGPTQSKASNWSLVSKLMQTKRVSCFLLLTIAFVSLLKDVEGVTLIIFESTVEYHLWVNTAEIKQPVVGFQAIAHQIEFDKVDAAFAILSVAYDKQVKTTRNIYIANCKMWSYVFKQIKILVR